MTVAQHGNLHVEPRPDGWRSTRPNSILMAGRRHPSALVGLPRPGLLYNIAASPPEEGNANGKLMKRVEEFAKSPKAKGLEKKMLRKAEDPKARAKISKRFKKLRKSA